MLKNTRNSYGTVIKFLHWFMALLFVAMFTLAYTMTNLPHGPVRSTLYDIHKATGLLLFGFFTFRLFWRLTNVQPMIPSAMPLWQRHLANWNIIALYIVMFIMPLTGFLTSTLGGHDISFYGLFKIPAFEQNQLASKFFSQTHEIISYLIIFFVALHFLGALHHHYFRKDTVLLSILPKIKKSVA